MRISDALHLEVIDVISTIITDQQAFDLAGQGLRCRIFSDSMVQPENGDSDENQGKQPFCPGVPEQAENWSEKRNETTKAEA